MAKKPTIDKSKLPKIKLEGPWQEKVDAAKRELFSPASWRHLDDAVAAVQSAKLAATRDPGSRDAATLAAAYLRLRALKDAVEAVDKEINLRVAAVEQTMWGAYESAETDRIVINGQPVAVLDDVSVKTVDKDALADWIRKNRLTRLFTVNANTLASLTKERIVAGLEPPAGVFVGTYTRTRLG